jgi:hypothetical protein
LLSVINTTMYDLEELKECRDWLDNHPDDYLLFDFSRLSF